MQVTMVMIDNVIYICYAVASLLFYPYLSSCATVTAAAEPEYTECLGQSSGSCDDLVRENCHLGGNILWLSDAVRDAAHCQEFLQLLGPVYGGSVFSYSSRDQVCYILDTGARECSSVSGPRQPSISDCTTTTTTATTTTTTAMITTTT